MMSVLAMALLSALLLTGCEEANFGWPDEISIATGGTCYPYGGGIASIITEKVAGRTAKAKVTTLEESVILVHKGEAEVGLVMGDMGYQAWAGEGRYEDNPQDILVAFQMYPNIYQIVTLEDFDVWSINDLKGKRVSIGARGSGTQYKTELVLAALGISSDEFMPEGLSFAEQTDALKRRNIEAAIWSAAPPASTILDLTTTQKTRFLSFSEEEISIIEATHPFYRGITMEANTYPGIDTVRTLAVWNSVIVHKDAPVDDVYSMVKAIFENRQDLIEIHRVNEWTTPRMTLENTSIPLHPGTIKYLDEIGLTVPHHMRPQEKE